MIISKLRRKESIDVFGLNTSYKSIMGFSEIGLKIEYDGKQNIAFVKKDCKEYPIGGLMCDYARFSPDSLKSLIIQNPYFEEKSLSEKGVDALWVFYNELLELYSPIVAEIIISEFSDYLRDFNCCDPDTVKSSIERTNRNIKEDAIKQYILQDSGFDEFGISTVGQALLTAYSSFSTSYIIFKHIFTLFVEGDYDNGNADKILSLYSEHVDFQEISFSLMIYDGGFHSIYTITSSLSLLAFEIAHVMDNETKIVKCKNCDNYFVPVGRSDAVYCGYPSPRNPGKACRDIGAHATQTKKMKEDVVTTEYRRLYMRLKMRLNRHPEDKRLREKLTQLTGEMKVLRKKRAAGIVSSDDILEWVSSIDEAL